MWNKTIAFAAALLAALMLTLPAAAAQAEDIGDDAAVLEAVSDEAQTDAEQTDAEQTDAAQSDGEQSSEAEDASGGNDRAAGDFVELRLRRGGGEHSAYVRGYGDGSFKPEKIMSRAEGAQLIYSLLDTRPDARRGFSDVSENDWFYDAVGTLAAGGVISPAEYYEPNADMSRGEFVTMLGRLFPDGDYDCPFTDVAEDSEYARGVAKAAHYGWVSGFPDGSFRPESGLSRAQTVTVLNKALGRSADRQTVDAELIIPAFSDVTRGHWAYYEISEAAITHGIPAADGEDIAYFSECWTGMEDRYAAYGRDTTVMVGRELYYIDSDGKALTDAWAGKLYFGPDGRYTCGDEWVDEQIKDILAQVTMAGMSREEMLHAAYDHTRDSYTYLRRNYYKIGDTGWELENGKVMLETKRGNCYCYTSVFLFLSRQLGYDSTAISGVVGTNRSPHGWVEIDFDGVTYIFDTELEMSYRQKGIYYYDFYMMPYSRIPWPYVK